MRSVLWLCLLLGAALGGQAGTASAEGGSEHVLLTEKIRDGKAPLAQRERAFAAFARLYPEDALLLAPSLLGDPALTIRFRAAWILADQGREDGLRALRSMAADPESSFVPPIEALGRVKDTGSHELLRELLAKALQAGEPPQNRARLAALAGGLSEYADPKDEPLLANAVRLSSDPSPSWPMVEALGVSGAPEAIPLLEEIFDRGKGLTVVAAGLGLARCGTPKGRDYVKDRLSDPRTVPLPEATFLLEHICVSADEPLVPVLLKIASEPGFGDDAKVLAWLALFRVDSPRQYREVLTLAWRSLRFDGAARFVVVHDEEQARSAPDLKTNHPKADGNLSPIIRALSASARERRRWRESRAYSF